MEHNVTHLTGHDLVIVKVTSDTGTVIFEGISDVSHWAPEDVDEMVEYLSVLDSDAFLNNKNMSNQFFNNTRIYH